MTDELKPWYGRNLDDELFIILDEYNLDGRDIENIVGIVELIKEKSVCESEQQRHEPEKKSADKKTVTMWQAVIKDSRHASDKSMTPYLFLDKKNDAPIYHEDVDHEIRAWIKHEVELV